MQKYVNSSIHPSGWIFSFKRTVQKRKAIVEEEAISESL